MATIIAPVSDSVDATLQLHRGFTEDATQADQYFIRPGFLYNVNDRLSLGGSYANIQIGLADVPDLREQRISQQLGYVFRSDDTGPLLQTRTQLEQRFASDADGTNWRLRHQTRLDLPILRQGEIRAVLWNETFYSLNDTEWSGPSGFTQTWNFVGVSIPVTEDITVEPGYLNLNLFRPGDDDVLHVAGLFVTISF